MMTPWPGPPTWRDLLLLAAAVFASSVVALLVLAGLAWLVLGLVV
jgi:hypothetical protein